MAGKLIDEVRSGDLEQSFASTGNVRDTENAYPAIDVFTQTAEREGFGLSAAEAMASGTAVVAANTGAIPVLIKHSETGLLDNVGDIPGLAENITMLLRLCYRRGLLF